jgi:hypothetical protein
MRILRPPAAEVDTSVLRNDFGNVIVFGNNNQIGASGSGNSFGIVDIVDAEGNTVEENTIFVVDVV